MSTDQSQENTKDLDALLGSHKTYVELESLMHSLDDDADSILRAELTKRRDSAERVRDMLRTIIELQMSRAI